MKKVYYSNKGCTYCSPLKRWLGKTIQLPRNSLGYLGTGNEVPQEGVSRQMRKTSTRYHAREICLSHAELPQYASLLSDIGLIPLESRLGMKA
jgi:hypothetical protein